MNLFFYSVNFFFPFLKVKLFFWSFLFYFFRFHTTLSSTATALLSSFVTLVFVVIVLYACVLCRSQPKQTYKPLNPLDVSTSGASNTAEDDRALGIHDPEGGLELREIYRDRGK